ncbi:Protein kinase domain-containing protein [Mycena sanguinolenta]|uniref:non-specific serine/threonine protein kinase n=1 Tax=Mycena sanguinolenta TaxID=230812 RepID=A0A8H6ZBN4_9AGAR|nr:Protein kinase domain-containing protein [Mycena sanguinolenta]
MLKAEPTVPAKPSLADLSRNASVISNSSTDSEELLTPPRPRPVRTFSAPRSRSPQSPTSRGASRPPPSYLSRELGYEDSSPSPSGQNGKPAARPVSKPPSKPSLQDFQFGRTLGEGSYSTVKLATSRTDGKHYAVKIITKEHLKRANKVPTANAERQALIRLHGHPGIVSLYHAFQDEWSLYFVIDLAINGEMQSLISRLGSLSTRCVQYYAAQIADAMEYMHSKDVLHRDLKPENLLLDDAYRIKITDFGTGKVLENGAQRAMTFVGTAQYQAPELLELKETTRSSDYWAFGCVIYQMIAGRFAFNDRSDYLTWQKVKRVEYEFPNGFDEQAKDLVTHLLVHDQLQRLGAGPRGSGNDPAALKAHPFFASIAWTSLWTDPAPPIEAGLVKKEHPLAQGEDRNWEDVGAAWDELVNHDDDSDELEWASDAEARRRTNGHGTVSSPPFTTDVGPRNEIRLSAFPSVQDNQDNVRHRSPSSSSSSDRSSSGNAADRLRDSLERLEIRSSGRSSPDGPARRDAIRNEIERGRDRAPTPLFATNSNDADHPNFLTTVKLMEDERVLFDSPVEARKGPRRRASRILIPIAGTVVKPKRRHLVLTNRRLICLKQDMSIKLELVLRPPEKSKDKAKDTRAVVTDAQLRGDREFAVTISQSKPYIFGVLYPFSASAWVEKINDALATDQSLDSRT